MENFIGTLEDNCVIFHMGFVYKLNPNKEQRHFLNQTGGNCRWVYNYVLARINKEHAEKKPVSRYHQTTPLLVELKKEEKTAFLQLSPAPALQQTLRDLDKNVAASFRKEGDPAKRGWPRYKARDLGDSFRLPVSTLGENGIDEEHHRVRVPKCGSIPYFKSRPMVFTIGEDDDAKIYTGKPLNVTFRRNCGDWYITITVRFSIPVEEFAKPKALENMVGADVGIVHSLTLSDGRTFDLNIAKIRKLEEKIVKLQRELARNRSRRKALAAKGLAPEYDKHKPGRKDRKLKHRIAKLFRKIRNIRDDFNKKVAWVVAHEYGNTAMEDLRLKNMTKSARGTAENPGRNVRQKSGLNRALLRVAPGNLRRAIEWAQAKEGGRVILVNPANTSRQCPHCGFTAKENRPSQAVFKCQQCGYEENADVVGAINILRRAQQQVRAE